MLFTTSLIAVATISFSVSASPIERETKNLVSVPLRRNISISSVKSLVEQGQRRIAAINGLTSLDTSLVGSGVVTNIIQGYLAPVSIGGNIWNLVVDTGSSTTWCGAQERCERTATGTSTGNSVTVRYGSGSFSGTEYIDEVSFGGLTVTSQSIGAAFSATGFQGTDGILGLGPIGLTVNTVAATSTVPTFMNNLKAQRSITTEVLGVSFRSVSGRDTSSDNGVLTLGGVDTSQYTGPLTYFPKLQTGAAARHWGISIAKFTYGSVTLQSSATGIVDTGTTLIYIPDSAYNAFLAASGGRTDSVSGLASFTTKPTSNFGVTFGSTTYTLTPDQYLIPTAQYSFFGVASGKYYALISAGGLSGVNCLIGLKFLEHYYSVYDETNSRIGFAANS
ncbi:probable aspartic proteinase precursor [Rhynchosporium agropyri]|uniref:Probable aspartic proteinase n=1 Tax=Rhynchosporium agropyri TaxID=914238 RepID=A0A1E1LRD5_9HELO|nr:probable aspartic proteinase precursor [Rhynchosporium agropyri]